MISGPFSRRGERGAGSVKRQSLARAANDMNGSDDMKKIRAVQGGQDDE
jgi:hypothetical protein